MLIFRKNILSEISGNFPENFQKFPEISGKAHFALIFQKNISSEISGNFQKKTHFVLKNMEKIEKCLKITTLSQFSKSLDAIIAITGSTFKMTTSLVFQFTFSQHLLGSSLFSV